MKIIQTADLTPDTKLDPMTKYWVYNGLDCCVTAEVLTALETFKDNQSASTYAFSQALQGPIMEMTVRGILVDQRKRDESLKIYGAQLKQLEEQWDRILTEGIGLPETLNWASSVKMMELFYTILGLPPVRKRNSKGQFAPTVNIDAIESLQNYFIAEPLCLHLLKLREVDKKRQLLEKGIDRDGRIRTSLNIAGTNTGRLASSISDYGTGDNLQNVDKELRYPMVADEGMMFCNLDLEQGDARNVGALCWELFVDQLGPSYAGSYLDACESGDLHTTVCRMAWPDLPWGPDPKHWRSVADGIGYRWLSYRDLAKKLGHGTNYYGTPPTMAKHTKVPKPAIEEFQHKYFRAFPVIGQPHGHKDFSTPNYHNWVRKQLKQYGHITHLFGRRRFFFGRESDDSTLREAIAYAPQGMTADEIDIAILNIFRLRELERWKDTLWLLMQVHDSILVAFPEELCDEIVPWLLKVARAPLVLSQGREFYVPVEAKIGWNWGDVVYNKDGSIKSNPDGLVKWKGHNTRQRTEPPVRRQQLIREALW